MTNEQMRIEVAKVCGWTHIEESGGEFYGWKPGETMPQYSFPLPRYTEDLNAMHEAEKVLPLKSQIRGDYLVMLARSTDCQPTFATAAQRCEAFLRVMKPGLFQPGE